MRTFFPIASIIILAGCPRPPVIDVYELLGVPSHQQEPSDTNDVEIDTGPESESEYQPEDTDTAIGPFEE